MSIIRRELSKDCSLSLPQIDNKKMILPKFLLSIILTINILTIFAQTKGKISGSVVNASTKEPVDYTSISLIDQQTGKVVNGVITDAKGNFSLAGLAPGT